MGSHVGGFVDCLLQRGAAKVYSIDTAYGILAWKLRKDPRVVVMERTNAMHAILPEAVDLVTIDAGWTRQEHILPNAQRMLKHDGRVLTLIKPHYEADKLELVHGVLSDSSVGNIVRNVCSSIQLARWEVHGVAESPIRGHGGNREQLALLSKLEP